MVHTSLRLITLAAMLNVAACSGGSPASSPAGTASFVPTSSTGSQGRGVKPLSSRASPAVLVADCNWTAAAYTAPVTALTNDAAGFCSHVQLNAGAFGPTTPADLVPGYHPTDLQSAYKLPSLTAGSNQTIGIIVAGRNPNAESDLAVYRSTFGLPACSSANGCLKMISAQPAAKPPKTPFPVDPNWAPEVAIDLDMASAVCPNCKLLLVTAASAQSMDLAAAAYSAAQSGATVVSNSYVIPESKNLKSLTEWTLPGVPIVAAAGDQGYQSVTNWPASSTNAIAVGGTTLVPSTNARGWSETVWSGSGSGCSSLAKKPSWQTDTGCHNRTVADVAAVADPATPVAVYNSYQSAGWVLMAGTSVATPIVAGAYALAGNGSSIGDASSLYSHSAALNPVTSGSNGACSVSYLCVAGGGYSGPAGLGSPNGIAAF